MGARPGFVGRASELADLRALLDSARSGRGGLAVVVGEPGIGKTALVECAVADAAIPVLWARGREGAPPLWLWDQVVRAARSAGLIDLPPTPASAGDDLGASGHQRFRRFDALTTRLLELAGRTPFAIVLDDVHWADHDSLALLEFMSPSLAGAALAAIATSRTGELDPLPRADRTIELSGLDAAHLAELIELHTGTAPSQQTLSEVVARTGGNPFFVAEVARLLRATGRDDEPSSWSSALPQGVRGVLVRRFARLPQSTHATMLTASVLGAEVDVTVLAGIMGDDRDNVLELLAPAVHAGLLLDLRDGRLRFQHALVRDAAAGELDTVQRRRLHARAAEVLEATSGRRSAAAIATHLAAAGDTAAAERWAERAGDQALQAAMYAEAADWYARAAEAGTARAAVKHAGALARCGRIAEADQAYAVAIARARAGGDAESFALAALGIGTLGGGFEVRLLDSVQLRMLNEALDAIGTDDSALRAMLLARLSVASTLGAEQARRVAMAEEAVAIATRVGHAGALAQSLAAWCDAHAGPRHTDERRAAAAEMLAAAQRSGDPELELLARRFEIVAHMERGDLPLAWRAIDAFTELADRLRQPQFCWFARLVEGMRAHLRGDLDTAQPLAEEASRIGRSISSGNARMLADGALIPILARDRGEPGFVEMIASATRDHPEVARAMDGALLYGVGYGVDRDTAARVLAAFDGVFPVDADDGIFLQVASLIADAAAFVGDQAWMALAEQALAPYPDHFVLDGTAAVCYLPVAASLARLAAARGDVEQARQLFDRARNLVAPIGAPLLLASLDREIARLGAEPSSATEQTDGAPVLRREGDLWFVAFDGGSAYLKHSKGIGDLAVLLARPGAEVHVFDLVAASDGHDRSGVRGRNRDVGEMIDSTARADYERRVRDLTDEIEEAERHHDDERAARLDAERAAILEQLASALGLSGRARRSAGDAERARKAVGMRIRDAIARIDHELPPLGRHLAVSIRTGMFCAYLPERPLHWQCQP